MQILTQDSMIDVVISSMSGFDFQQIQNFIEHITNQNLRKYLKANQSTHTFLWEKSEVTSVCQNFSSEIYFLNIGINNNENAAILVQEFQCFDAALYI